MHKYVPNTASTRPPAVACSSVDNGPAFPVCPLPVLPQNMGSKIHRVLMAVRSARCCDAANIYRDAAGSRDRTGRRRYT